MADDTLTFVVGLVLGAAVIALVLMHMRDNGGQQQAALTTHNVVRDDEGRIQSVDTMTGLPMGQQQAAPAPQPMMEEPQVPRIGDHR